MEALQAAKKIYQDNKAMTLVSRSNGETWAGKVYFAEDDGYIWVALEQSRNYRNIEENPRVFFVIEHGVPDRFIQGEGVAEMIGPIEDRPERHMIFRKVFELVPFAKAFPGVTLIRIRPIRLFISDFTGDWKPRAEVEVTDDVLQVFQTTLKTQWPAWRVYLQATRYFAFTVTLFSVLIGALLAPSLDWGLLGLTLLGALLLHAGINIVSDYFDYRRGADTWQALGSSRVLVDGLMTPSTHIRFGLTLLWFGSLIGLTLIYLRGLPVLYLGLAGIFIGLFYTAPPLGFKYFALGDLSVFLAFGPLLLLGSYYVQAEAFAVVPLAVSIPLGLLTAAVLHGNNFRDIAEDSKAGYRTLAAFLGPRGSGYYYLSLVALAYVLVLVYIGLDWLPWTAALVLMTLPSAWRNVRVAFRPARVAFTFLDLMTAQLHLYFGLFLTLGYSLDRFTGLSL